MNRAMLLACWSVLTGSAIALGWVFWSLLWPFQLLDASAGSFKIANKDKLVHQGESVLLHWRGCRYTDRPAYVATELSGSLLLSLPPRVSTRAAGCYDDFYPIAYIGQEVPPGPYKARLIVSFHVNPLRTVEYVYETDQFRVVSGQVTDDRISDGIPRAMPVGTK